MASLATQLACHPASPVIVSPSLTERFKVHTYWCEKRRNCYGGIDDAGEPYLEFAHGVFAREFDSLLDWSYIENPSLRGAFPDLIKVHAIPVLCCLVAHEVAHMAVFDAQVQLGRHTNASPHGRTWQRLYRYLRSNLLFALATDFSINPEIWAGVSSNVIAEIENSDLCLSDYLDDLGNLSNDELERCMDALCIDMNYNDVMTLSTVSVELMGASYAP